MRRFTISNQSLGTGRTQNNFIRKMKDALLSKEDLEVKQKKRAAREKLFKTKYRNEIASGIIAIKNLRKMLQKSQIESQYKDNAINLVEEYEHPFIKFTAKTARFAVLIEKLNKIALNEREQAVIKISKILGN